jgi:hypothetical protein
MDERYESYSPITFRITYKAGNGGADDTIACSIPKSNAYQIVEDLDRYLDESARNIARIDSHRTFKSTKTNTEDFDHSYIGHDEFAVPDPDIDNGSYRSF